MKSIFNFFLIIGVLTGLNSCGPARFVEPLRKYQNAIALDVGGPVISVPDVATTPIPFSSITYGRGITNKLTIHGSWYTTAAIFGVAQIGAGATYGIWKSKRNKHGISTMLGFNTAIDVFENNFKFWPQLDAHYYFKYNHKQINQEDLLTSGRKVSNLLYFGVGTWYELDRTKAHGERQQTLVIPMLNFGHDLNWSRWTLKTELKLIAPFTSNENLVVDYFSLTGKNGATGVYLGLIRKF
jgi:hypothetical protein